MEREAEESAGASKARGWPPPASRPDHRLPPAGYGSEGHGGSSGGRSCAPGIYKIAYMNIFTPFSGSLRDLVILVHIVCINTVDGLLCRGTLILNDGLIYKYNNTLGSHPQRGFVIRIYRADWNWVIVPIYTHFRLLSLHPRRCCVGADRSKFIDISIYIPINREGAYVTYDVMLWVYYGWHAFLFSFLLSISIFHVL